MSFKNKIDSKIILPARESGESMPRTVGVILDISEKTNECVVRYPDARGVLVAKSNVPIRGYTNSPLDWFPEIGDTVTVEVNGKAVIVTGLLETRNTIYTKGRNYLKNDIYTDNLTCNTVGGCIF